MREVHVVLCPLNKDGFLFISLLHFQHIARTMHNHHNKTTLQLKLNKKLTLLQTQNTTLKQTSKKKGRNTS